jgi:uncharacterized protein YjbJ (UPF0337 family)
MRRKSGAELPQRCPARESANKQTSLKIADLLRENPNGRTGYCPVYARPRRERYPGVPSTKVKEFKMKRSILSTIAISAATLFGAAQVHAANDLPAKGGQQSVQGQAKGWAQDKAGTGDPKTRAEVRAETARATIVDGQESVKDQGKGWAQDKAGTGDPKTRAEVRAETARATIVDGQESVKDQGKGWGQKSRQ